MRPSDLRANLALALASTLVSFLLAAAGYEAVANARYQRWRTWADARGKYSRLTVPSRNPRLVWEYRPYGQTATIRTNRWGFRDRDYPTPDKPAGAHRLAFLGDSVTLGLGVQESETFVRLLGDRAAVSGRVEVLNFSVDGYNALQVRELLSARALDFAPDRVVYVLCLNDFDLEDSSGEKLLYFRKPASFLQRDLATVFRRLRGVEFHHDHFGRNRERVFRCILEMRDILAARNAGFLVAIVPVFGERGPGTTGYPLADLHQAIAGFAAENGIPTHDLLADLRRQRPSLEGLGLDPWHLSPEGHRLVAESLFPVLFPQ